MYLRRNTHVMQNVTLRMADDLVEALDGEADDRDVTRSEYIRNILESRHEDSALQSQVDELQAQRDALRGEYEEKLAERDQEIERLHRERRQLLEQREENKELVRYAEQQRSVLERQEERRDAPAWTRAKWWLFGRSGEKSE